MNYGKIARLSLATLVVSLGATASFAGKFEQTQQQSSQQAPERHLTAPKVSKSTINCLELQHEVSWHITSDTEVTRNEERTVTCEMGRRLNQELPLLKQPYPGKKLLMESPNQCQQGGFGVGDLASQITYQDVEVDYDGTETAVVTFKELSKQRLNINNIDDATVVPMGCRDWSVEQFLEGSDGERFQRGITLEEGQRAVVDFVERLRANGGMLSYRTTHSVDQNGQVQMKGQAQGQMQGAAVQGQAQAQAQEQAQAPAQISKIAPPAARKGK